MSRKFLILLVIGVLSIILVGCTFVNSSTHTIGGYVKDALGNAVPNVTLHISYPNGYKTTFTNDRGYWSESSVIGKTTITPEATGWTFNPPTKTLYVDKNENNVNFTGNPLNYFVSGYVKDGEGNGISGVTITFESSQSEATPVKTNLSGFWKSGLLNGKVKVRALKNGWLFHPNEIPVSGLRDDVNFIAEKGIGETMYIPLQGNPGGLTVDEEGGRLFVSDSSTDTVAVFNIYGYNKIGGYHVGSSPAGICYDSNDNRLFVANSATDTISVVDASNDKLIKNVLIGGTPQGIAFNPTTGSVYVTNSYYNAVNVLKASPTSIIATIRVGKSPNGVAVNPITNMVYITNKTDGTVSVIDGKDNSLADDIKVGSEPIGIAVNYVTNKVYVVNHGNGTVSVINGETDSVVKTIKVGNGPSYVSVNTLQNMIYVTNTSDNTLSVIDGDTDAVIQTVIVGKGPTWVTFNKKIGVVYVSNTEEKTVSVVH